MRAITALALAAAVLAARPAPAQLFVAGFNQAWIEGKYGRDLSSAFVEADWARVFRLARAGGATAVRVWLFEGMAKEGVVWNGKVPARVDPALVANVRRVIALAASNGVRIYWTSTSANWAPEWPRAIDYERHWNIFQDRYEAGRLFREKCLGPVLDAIRERPEALYALDLLNEAQGGVKNWAFKDGWAGARRYLAATAAFVHARAPGIKVSASSGHTEAIADFLAGRFDGLGLDLYDVHVYADAAAVPHGQELARHARRRGLPIVIGEYGQAKKADDPALQARVTGGMLADARRLGFAAAFAWRLDDGKGRFRFFDGARERPALAEFRRVARAP